MQGLWSQDIRNCENDIRKNPEASGFMVPGYLVGDLPEERS
jgi:hypothetical protein